MAARREEQEETTSEWWTQQTGTTENSWKEMMCALYHTMIISTAYEFQIIMKIV